MDLKSFWARWFSKKSPPPAPVRLRLLNTYPLRDAIPEVELLCVHLRRVNDQIVAIKYEDALATDMHLRLIKKRLEVYSGSLCVDLRIMLLLHALIDRPAIATLWAYTLHRMIEALGPQDEFLSYALFMEYFAEGFPTEEGYRLAWNDQKAGPINLLDTPEQWQ